MKYGLLAPIGQRFVYCIVLFIQLKNEEICNLYSFRFKRLFMIFLSEYVPSPNYLWWAYQLREGTKSLTTVPNERVEVFLGKSTLGNVLLGSVQSFVRFVLTF